MLTPFLLTVKLQATEVTTYIKIKLLRAEEGIHNLVPDAEHIGRAVRSRQRR